MTFIKPKKLKEIWDCDPWFNTQFAHQGYKLEHHMPVEWGTSESLPQDQWSYHTSESATTAVYKQYSHESNFISVLDIAVYHTFSTILLGVIYVSVKTSCSQSIIILYHTQWTTWMF